MTHVTVENLSGDHERVNLPDGDWYGSGWEIDTGVELLALYSGPKTGRRFGCFKSAWVDNQGCPRGIYYRELSESEYLQLCVTVNTEPVKPSVTEA